MQTLKPFGRGLPNVNIFSTWALTASIDMGVDGFKTDGGEFIYRPDVRFCDGSDGKSGKNRYARDYTCAYRDFIGSQRVLFSRAGFSGQHTVPMHWGGDQQAQNAELRRTKNCEASFTPDCQPRHPVFCSGALILPGLQARFRRWTSTAAQHRWPASARSCNGIQSRTAGSLRN